MTEPENFTDSFECTASGEWTNIDGQLVPWTRMNSFAADSNGVIAVRTTKMPSNLSPWLPNALMEEAQRRGAQAGDIIRGTYRPNGDKLVLDPCTVEIERPLSDPDDTVTP